MKRICAALLSLLFLAACSADPMIGVREKLKAKDYPAAKAQLEELVKTSPDKPEPHYALFILYQYFMANNDSSATAGSIREYEWIAKQEGLALNYTNMEASLRGSSKSRIFYKEAREAMYGAD